MLLIEGGMSVSAWSMWGLWCCGALGWVGWRNISAELPFLYTVPVSSHSQGALPVWILLLNGASHFSKPAWNPLQK